MRRTVALLLVALLALVVHASGSRRALQDSQSQWVTGPAANGATPGAKLMAVSELPGAQPDAVSLAAGGLRGESPS